MKMRGRLSKLPQRFQLQKKGHGFGGADFSRLLVLLACAICAPMAQAQSSAGFAVPNQPGRYYNEGAAPAVPNDLPVERLQPPEPVSAVANQPGANPYSNPPLPPAPAPLGSASALPNNFGNTDPAVTNTRAPAANASSSSTDQPVTVSTQRWQPGSVTQTAPATPSTSGFAQPSSSRSTANPNPSASEASMSSLSSSASSPVMPATPAPSGMSGMDYRLPGSQELPSSGGAASPLRLKTDELTTVTPSSAQPERSTPAASAARPLVASADAPIETAVMRAVAENLAENLLQTVAANGIKADPAVGIAMAIPPERIRRAQTAAGGALRESVVQSILNSDYIQQLRPAFNQRFSTEFSTYETQALNQSAKAGGVQKLLVLSSYGPITDEVLKRDFNPIERDDVLALLRSPEWRKLQALMARFFDADLAPVTPVQQRRWEAQLSAAIERTTPVAP